MPGSTSRLALPYPVGADNNNVPADMLALATALDNAAMYEQGAVGSIPAGTAKPNGTWYADTATRGLVYVNVGTGAGRAYRALALNDDVDEFRKAGHTLIASGPTYAPATTITAADNWVYVNGAYVTDGASSPMGGAFYFDPALYALTGRTTQLRLLATWTKNGTVVGHSPTLRLYPISSVSGGSVVLGANVASVTMTEGLANESRNGSITVTAPAAGYYVVAMTTTAAFAASSALGIMWRLEVRWT